MKRRLLLHLLFWAAYWFIFAYTYSRYDGNWFKYACTEAMQMPFRMMATYLAFWCMDHFRSPWATFSAVAFSVFLGGLATRIFKMIYLVPVWFADSSFEFWSYRFMVDVFDCALAAGVALSARLYFRQQDLQRRESALRAEKSEAELRALKNQLQPHFLFNTINNLYALARVKSDKTAPVALQLAQLLRYVLYESAKERVSVAQEIQHIRDYVALEKLRFDEERLQVDLKIEIDDPEQAIPPLLLLPLVENAFKHGAAEQYSDAWVRIDLSLDQKVLILRVENSRSSEKIPHEGGIGLKNLRRQLELIYPENSQLELMPGEQVFCVNLKIWNL